MKSALLILLIVAATALTTLVMRFGLGGDEDAWLCQDGAWVKHGSPSARAPVGGCGPTRTPGDGQRACTMEAKLCPDGSYVGRTGPRCEFAPCP